MQIFADKCRNFCKLKKAKYKILKISRFIFDGFVKSLVLVSVIPLGGMPSRDDEATTLS